jgi:hypothetical protein
MSDFIREVDEDYRRDRAMAFLARYQVLIAIVFVTVIAGAGGYRLWADRQVSQAEAANARFAAAADLAAQGKTADATAAFAAIAQDGPAPYAMLARMRSAETLAKGDPEGGAKAFDAIAADDPLPPSIRDAARLRSAMIRIDREDPKAFEQRYGRFAEPGIGFSSGIRELLALAALKRQDFAAAGRYLDAIITDPNAPSALRGRAQAFRTLVVAGPATAAATQPPPANVKIVGETAAPVAPPAAPTQPAAVPPSIKPPGTTPPD